MKAMIFAAGEGRRMRPLTLHKPKPLLEVASASLLEHKVRELVAAGIDEIVVNASYLAEQIEAAVERMSSHCTLYLSREPTALETGGGLKQALTYLGDEPFVLINGDVWSDFELKRLISIATSLDGHSRLAHLVLVPNPDHNAGGDFNLNDSGMVNPPLSESESTLTFSGISVLHPQLVYKYAPDCDIFPLTSLLLPAMSAAQVSGECHQGFWSDIGTPERLNALKCHLEGA